MTSKLRLAALAACCGAIAIALWSPLDRMAELSFTAHMAQHMLLIFIAAPLLLLAEPLRLVLRALPHGVAKRLAQTAHGRVFRSISHPIFSWFAFAAVLWGVHFSPLYESALAHPPAHAAEHALLFGAALLFWQPVIAASPASNRMSHPARMIYLFAAIPQSAFLGLALYQSRFVLYPHYLRSDGSLAAALADQHAGGALMWIGGGLLLFSAFMLTAGAWASSERRAAVRVDRALALRVEETRP